MAGSKATHLNTDFRQANEYADLMLIVEDEKLHTSSYTLAMVSPRIAAMLSDAGKKDGRFVIDLPGVSSNAVISLLTYLLPNSNYEYCEAKKLATAAHYFEIDWLSDLCEEILISQFESTKSEEERLDLLLIAQNMNLEKLSAVAVKQFAALKITDLKKQVRYSEISSHVLLTIQDTRLENLDSKPETPIQPTNVKLVVEEQEIIIDRGIISTASPVFAAMFSSNMLEGKTSIANLPGKSFKAVDFVAKFLVSRVESGESLTIPDDILKDVCSLSEEYQVMVLKSECEKQIVAKINDKLEKSKLEEYYEASLHYNLHIVCDVAKKALAQRFDTIDVKKLSETSLNGAGLVAMKKLEILDALIVTLQENAKKDKKKIKDLEAIVTIKTRQAKEIDDLELHICEILYKIIEGNKPNRTHCDTEKMDRNCWKDLESMHHILAGCFNEKNGKKRSNFLKELAEFRKIVDDMIPKIHR